MLNIGKRGRVHTRLEQGLLWLGAGLCVASLIWFTASPAGDRQGGWLITVAILLYIVVEILYRTRIKRATSAEHGVDPARPDR